MFFQNLTRYLICIGVLTALVLKSIFVLPTNTIEQGSSWKNTLDNLERNKLEKLNGGLTNQTYKLQKGNKTYAIRFGTPDKERLSIDRVEEIKFHSYGALLGISPKIYYADSDSGILVTHFISGKTLTKQVIEDQATLKKIVILLKKFHSNTRKKPFKLGEDYLRSIVHFQGLQNSGDYFSSKISEALKRIYPIFEKMAPEDHQVVSHNDFFLRNLIFTKEKLWLIDWEYAGWGSIYNDLASLVMEDQLDNVQIEKLLLYYFGKIVSENIEKLTYICALYSLQSACWNYSQSQHTKNDNSDYKQAIKHHLKKFWRCVGILEKKLEKEINING